MQNYNLVVDVGSSNTALYKAGQGIVLKEPTIIAETKIGNKNILVDVGIGANKLLEKGEKDLDFISPIDHGIIKDRQLVSQMLGEFLGRIGDKKLFNRNKLLYVIPSSLNEKEMIKCKNLSYSLNVSKSTLIQSSILAYIASSIDDKIRTKLIINIGGGTTDIALVFNMKVLAGITIGIGGKDIDKKIADMFIKKDNLVINPVVLEDIKKELATLLPNDIITVNVPCKDYFSGEEKNVKLSSKETILFFERFFDEIYKVAKELKDSCKDEALEDLKRGGVYICGGMANVTGVDRFFKTRLGLPVVVEPEPENAIMKGAEILLNSPWLQDRIYDEI